ncbi:MAG: T9SS type A sorting domain-containing protein [Phycisphaeraceae bacterium]|nr:T9SS type A sorting domain-containing protein [Phycisphaeraceae bacterium]
MLLYTPALLSINEAKNLTSMKFTYTNGKFIPICMTVGANDAQYTGIDAEVQAQLAAISNKSMLKVLSGVGHNVPQTITDYQQCYNFVEANVYVPTTGVDNISAEQAGIDIFPNPSQGIFYVGLNREIGLEDNITTRVYNVAGQKVYEQENNYMNQIHVVNLEGQPSGLYMVEVITPSGRFVKRVSVTE